MTSIVLLAGETSGDILASYLLKGLRAQGCTLPVWGIGGPALAAQGMECVESIDSLAVRGYVEVIGALPRLWNLRRALMAQAAHRKPSLCITVDAPDFNLAFAAKMKALGVPTVHFISPSIWAWRRERMVDIKLAVDLMLCVFPHEPALYRAAGVAACYVGHPMAQAVPMQTNRAAARAALGIVPAAQVVDAGHASTSRQTISQASTQASAQIISQTSTKKSTKKSTKNSHTAPVIALLPGSRAAEIKYILPRLLGAAQRMYSIHPAMLCVLPVASPALKTQVDALLSQHAGYGLNIITVLGRSDQVLAAADIGIIASGTATLEAALYKLPMVITYAMPRSSWAIMGHKNYLPWVGLPNILCQKWVVPELLQSQATPQALANEALALLADVPRRQAIVERFVQLHESLRCDTQTLAARAVMRLLP